MNPTHPIPLATWRIASIYIDCPTPNCGGGVESDGSFQLAAATGLPDAVKPNGPYVCGECGETFRVPTAALRALGVR